MVTQATDIIDPMSIPEQERNARTQFMVGIPLGLRIALRNYAAEQDPEWSEAKVIRTALAAFVQYDLPKAADRSGGNKLTDEQKKERQRQRNKEARAGVAALLAKYSGDSDVERVAASTGDDDDED